VTVLRIRTAPLRSLLAALTMLMWACAGARDVPAPIAAELRSREILIFQEESLEGVPTLVLAYRTQEPLFEAWPKIANEVAQVSPHLKAEADRRQLRGVRIVVRTPSDASVFDFRRSAEGWKDVWRDLLEVRRLPSGRSIGLQSIVENNDGDGQTLTISYVTTLSLSEQRAAVREEARSVLEAYSDKAERSGAQKVLVTPSSRLHDGVSVGLVFVREKSSGAWKPAF
jgi:hypothetical protein